MVQMLPVSGIFQHPVDGAHAARVLREKGYVMVALRPLANIDLSRLPLSQRESNSRLNWMIASALAAFLVLGAFGWFLGNAINMGLGVLVALAFAFFGIVAALLLIDQPAERHRRMSRDGGVVVTVHCPKDEENEVERTLRKTGAVEIQSVTEAGA